MTLTAPEAPPKVDPVGQLIAALGRIQGVATDIILAVGRNEPVASRDQLRLAAACDDVLAAVEAYQPLARPAVDLGDPLAMFRLPSGLVGFQEEGARWVMRGDIVQAVHGDEGRWEEVVGIVHAQTQTGITTRRDDGTTRLRWWGHENPVRVATAPVQVVADQERKAGCD